MTLGNSNNQADAGRPPLRYARLDDVQPDETLASALVLARRIEDLLEDARTRFPVAAGDDARTHSTRMARAMAASLVDELQALLHPARKTGSS